MSDQKGQVMKKYENITLTEYLKTLFPSDYGSRDNCGCPFLVTDLLPTTKYEGYNLIQVYQPGQAVIERIDDKILLNFLKNWTGFVFPVPSYGILAVPESTKEELKPKLAGVFKKIAFNKDEMTSEGIIQLLLGDLYESFSSASKADLRKKVQDLCKQVSHGALSEYFTYNQKNKPIQISFDASNAQSRAKFSRCINSWLETTTLFDFSLEFEDSYDIDENMEDETEDYED